MCNEGFTLVGAFERECLANRSWSAPLPSCESKFWLTKLVFIINELIVINCANLMAPENGNVVVPSTAVGSIATYTCNTGYRINGASQRECLSDETWSLDAPFCISKLTKGK